MTYAANKEQSRVLGPGRVVTDLHNRGVVSLLKAGGAGSPGRHQNLSGGLRQDKHIT